MSLFKKKTIKKTWNDITLNQFYKIQELLSDPDEYTECNLRQVIYGVDTSNMTIEESVKYDITFLGNEIDKKNVKLKETYYLNGKKYRSNINLTKVTTS